MQKIIRNIKKCACKMVLSHAFTKTAVPLVTTSGKLDTLRANRNPAEWTCVFYVQILTFIELLLQHITAREAFVILRQDTKS